MPEVAAAVVVGLAVVCALKSMVPSIAGDVVSERTISTAMHATTTARQRRVTVCNGVGA
jgi:hypothetical protein